MTKSFGPVVAVDDVELEVPEASITAVLGPSGCGKTTLLRLVAGFLEPDAGTIRFGDRVVAGAGRVGPAAGAPRRLRPAGGRALPAPRRRAPTSAFGLPRAQRRTRPGRRDARPGRAARVVRRPGTRTSSPAASSSASRWPARSRPTRRSCCSTSRSPRSTPRCARAPAAPWSARCAPPSATAVLVTHDQDEALSLADQVAVMRAGRLVQAADPARPLPRARPTPRSPASSAAPRPAGPGPRRRRHAARSATWPLEGPVPGRRRPRCWCAPSSCGSTDPARLGRGAGRAR